MIDDYTKKLIDMFEKLGNPVDNKEKYDLNDSGIKNLQFYFSAYESGMLREVVAISGVFPKVKADYNSNINEL